MNKQINDLEFLREEIKRIFFDALKDMPITFTVATYHFDEFIERVEQDKIILLPDPPTLHVSTGHNHGNHYFSFTMFVSQSFLSVAGKESLKLYVGGFRSKNLESVYIRNLCKDLDYGEVPFMSQSLELVNFDFDIALENKRDYCRFTLTREGKVCLDHTIDNRS